MLKLIRNKIGEKACLHKELSRLDSKFKEHFLAHSKRHRYLTIGDGHWRFNHDYFKRSLIGDRYLTSQAISRELAQIKSQPAKLEAEKRKIIDRFKLSQKAVDLTGFLAEVGHLRLACRVRAIIPSIWAWINVNSKLLKRSKLTSDAIDLEWLSPEEFQSFRHTNNEQLLKTAHKRRATRRFLILLESDQLHFYYGKQAKDIFLKLKPKSVVKNKQTQLQGVIAKSGFVKGRACVYKWGDDIDKKLKQMDKHDILITGQTRPTMMALISKARAIVTDEGGITSHAAIVARELNIPCLLNTVDGTDFFKDGDLVEVDANAGLVRRVKK